MVDGYVSGFTYSCLGGAYSALHGEPGPPVAATVTAYRGDLRVPGDPLGIGQVPLASAAASSRSTTGGGFRLALAPGTYTLLQSTDGAGPDAVHGVALVVSEPGKLTTADLWGGGTCT